MRDGLVGARFSGVAAFGRRRWIGGRGVGGSCGVEELDRVFAVFPALRETRAIHQPSGHNDTTTANAQCRRVFQCHLKCRRGTALILPRCANCRSNTLGAGEATAVTLTPRATPSAQKQEAPVIVPGLLASEHHPLAPGTGIACVGHGRFTADRIAYPVDRLLGRGVKRQPRSRLTWRRDGRPRCARGEVGDAPDIRRFRRELGRGNCDPKRTVVPWGPRRRGAGRC